MHYFARKTNRPNGKPELSWISISLDNVLLLETAKVFNVHTIFFFSQNLLVLVFLVQISSKACRERVKSCRLGLWGGMLFVPKLLEGVWLLPVIASLGGEAFQTILKPYSCISHVK